MAHMFVWRSGRIQLGDQVPDGSIDVATGSYDDLLTISLRLSHWNADLGYYEVAGVATAPDDGFQAVEQLIAFRDQVRLELRRAA